MQKILFTYIIIFISINIAYSSDKKSIKKTYNKTTIDDSKKRKKTIIHNGKIIIRNIDNKKKRKSESISKETIFYLY